MGVTGRLLWSRWSGKEAVERTECSKAPALRREAIREGTARAQAVTAREVGREKPGKEQRAGWGTPQGRQPGRGLGEQNI